MSLSDKIEYAKRSEGSEKKYWIDLIDVKDVRDFIKALKEKTKDTDYASNEGSDVYDTHEIIDQLAGDAII